MAFAFERNRPTTVTPGGINDTPAPSGPSVGGFAFQRSNIPAPVVTPGNPEEAEQAVQRQREVVDVVKDDPTTQNFLSRPENYEVAQEDAENLSALSQTLKTLEKYTNPFPVISSFAEQVFETPYRAAQGLIELDRAMRRQLTTGLRTSLEKIGLGELAEQVGTGGSVLDIIQEPVMEFTEFGRESAGNVFGVDEEDRTFATDVSGAMGQMSAQIALIMATGGLSSVGSVSLLGEGAAQIADDIEATGESVEENPEAVIAGAAITGLTERFGLDVLFNRLPASARGRIFKILAGAGSEASQEILEGVLVNLTALGIYDPDRQIVDDSLFEEGAVAGTAGAIFSAILPGRAGVRGQQVMDQAAEIAQNSNLAQTSPEKLAEHIDASLQDIGVEEVHIPGVQLAQWIAAQPDPQATLFGLGVENSLEEAVSLGGDVTISNERFAQWVMLSDGYQDLSPHLRLSEDAMTAAEAEEFAASGILEEVERVLDSQSDPAIDQDPALSQAEGLMGLRGMFNTADEAGMTPAKYQQYLVQLQRAAEKGAKNQELAYLRQEERENSKAWKEEEDTVRSQVEEHFSNMPVYAAFNGIQAERLDRGATQEVLTELGVELDALPKQKGGRAIYSTQKGEPGQSPDAYAQMHGYEDASEMFSDMLTSTPFEQAVAVETSRVMHTKHSDLNEERQRIIQAKQSLMTDEHAEVIQMEVNALREAQGQGRLKPKLVRQAAKQQLEKQSLRNIKPNKFLAASSRLAKEAGRALKRGDRSLAAELKFKQLLNYNMAKEAMKMQETIKRQKRFMNKFLTKKDWPSMHPDYLAAIKDVLAHTSFGPRLTPRRLESLRKVVEKSADPVASARKLLAEAERTNYQDMTLADFRHLHNTVKEIHHKGVTENKLREKTESRERDVIIAVLNEEVRGNLNKGSPGSVDPSKWEQAKRFGHDIGTTLMHIDTILREIDGFQDLGPAHQNILGRYNRAMLEGYQPGQQGFVAREKAEAQEIVNLYNVFTKKERLDFNKKVKVPGVSKKISRNTILSVLLNSGNQGNLDALVESKTFTEAEITAIHDFASKKDWDFAQSTWDYLEKFWPEVVATEQRRRNVTPEKVENKPINTKHGTYRGGYYPIRYDKKQSVFYSSEEAQELVDRVKFGDHVASHTAHSHTEARTESQGHKVLLDLFVLHSHTQRLLYDLEVGDAVTDLYKIIHDGDFKKVLTEQGHRHKWEAMDLWLRDVITGEIGVDNAWEKSLRWLRTRATVVGLGWNVGVIALQPLGMIQSSVVVGKRNMLDAMRIMAGSKWVGKNNIFDYIDSQSTFMATRSTTWHKDITDAQTSINAKFLDRVTPGDSADLIRESFFWGIKKTQRLADAITWIAAKKKGLQEFNGDENKAVKFADDVVMRSQASGLFGHRTAMERGTLGPGRQQTEWVRMFTLFYSYFARKLNVATEKTKRTRFKNPVSALSWANDMALLFFWEALLAGLVRGQWPDADDDEGFFEYAAAETAYTLLGTVPGGRETASAVQGFTPGGTPSRAAADLAKAIEQAGQAEIDAAFLKSMNSMTGLMFKYPAGQINKFIGATDKALQGDDVTAWEFLVGPDYDD